MSFDWDEWMFSLLSHEATGQYQDTIDLMACIMRTMMMLGDTTFAYSGSEVYAVGFHEISLSVVDDGIIDSIGADDIQFIMSELIDLGFLEPVWQEVDGRDVGIVEYVWFSYILKPAIPEFARV